MAPIYGWGSTTSRLEPLQRGSLLFTIIFPEIPGTHYINLGRITHWSLSVDLNTGPMDWESSTLSTRPLLHEMKLNHSQFVRILNIQPPSVQISAIKSLAI